MQNELKLKAQLEVIGYIVHLRKYHLNHNQVEDCQGEMWTHIDNDFSSVEYRVIAKELKIMSLKKLKEIKTKEELVNIIENYLNEYAVDNWYEGYVPTGTKYIRRHKKDPKLPKEKYYDMNSDDFDYERKYYKIRS